MKYKRILAGLFLAACIAAITGFADDPIEKIISSLSQWTSAHPQEKVYLHIDKPYYSAGDNIWFKAYVTAGSEHKLSAISGVLNVELVNDRDEVAMSEKLPVINGLSWGDFALADSLTEGNYRIRAYTNWMRNAGEDYFFDRNITIVAPAAANVLTKTNYTYTLQNGRTRINAVISYTTPDGMPYAGRQVSYVVARGNSTTSKGNGTTDDKGNLSVAFDAPENMKSPAVIATVIKVDDKKTIKKTVVVKTFSAKPDLQFFPEGGNLVAGNPTKIAFKAVGIDGLGAHVKGVVMDDQGKQVTTFSDLHDGMGVFDLTPVSGRTYKAEVTYPDGSKNTVPLPVAVNEGYTLSIDNSDPGKIDVHIMPGASVSAATQTRQLSLVAQSGGVIYYAGKSQPGMKSFTAQVTKNKFPAGIVQFTLFADDEPLNERLIFVQNNDQLKLEASADMQRYQPHQKTTIDLHALDKDGKPVVGSFSVAVTDESNAPFDENNSESIFSNLLLTSDLKGYIENPGYYFSNENAQTAAALDALLLTQGYRRFEWTRILSNAYPPVAFQPEKSLEISGHIKNLLGKPIANGRVTLFSTQGGVFMIDTLSDKNGRFVFKNLIFKDSVKFLIQARTAKDHKNVTIDVDNIVPSKPVGGNNKAGWLINVSDLNPKFQETNRRLEDERLQYELSTDAIRLKEVQIKAAKINPAENSTNLNGPGNADQVVGADVIAKLSCAHLGDCLQGMLAGVRFQNGIPYLASGGRQRMTILVDGIPADTDLFSNLNPADIASIEVLRSIAYTSIYGGRGGNGVLIITTKHGDGGYSVQHYAPGILTYSPQGYYKARVFYNAPAGGGNVAKSATSNGRTIYWNANIITGKDGKATIEYNNTSAKGSYKVIIEGIDNNGKPGRAVLKYNVE